MSTDIAFSTGGESFAEIITSGAYYVDKTAYLKRIFLTSRIKNAIFIRPRRFGKTLNLSMMRDFCELNYQKPGDKSRQQKLFIDNGRNLAVAGDDYAELRDKIMGEFPVISVSFRSVEGSALYIAVSALLNAIFVLYSQYRFLTDSLVLDTEEKKYFKYVYEFCTLKKDKLYLSKNLKEAETICGSFISRLALMLYREYGRQVIVIIDEYDVPLQKAVTAEEPYYNRMLDIIRQIFSSTFKTDSIPWLYKGIVSGCLRIAHQSIFTGANNFTIYGMDDRIYSGFFGFTRDEARRMLEDCGMQDREDEVRAWYDGYRIGNEHIYCPWSLCCYCDEVLNDSNSKPKPFWVNTSGNDIISLFTKSSIEAHDADNISRLQDLTDGKDVVITLSEFTTYPDIRQRVEFNEFMTMMLHTGYVTYADDCDLSAENVHVRIPNHEVRSCFARKYAALYSKGNRDWQDQAEKLVDLLLENRAQEAQILISSMLREFLSIRNSGSELYYHGFMSGVLGPACAARGAEFHDETEKGDGYPDMVIVRKSSPTAVVMEFKTGKNDLESLLRNAKSAAEQILTKKYAEPYIRTYSAVHALGVAFGGKDCVISSLGNLAAKA